MKIFIKTVCITLCISVAMLFFSNSKKVEAVATTTTVSAIVVYAVGAIIAALTTYFIVDNADEICNFVQSSAFSDTLIVDDDGTAAINPSAAIPDGISPVTFNALQKEAVKAVNSHIHFSESGGTHGGGGKNRMPSGDWQNALSAAVGALSVALTAYEIEGIQTKNAYENVYGESGFMNRDIQVIDGKPQHVTSSYSPEVINVFERLGIKYTMLQNITDTHLYYRKGAESNFQLNTYYQSFIMKNGNIYKLGSGLTGYFRSAHHSNFFSDIIFCEGYTGFNVNNLYTYLPNNETAEIKLVNIEGQLCVAYYHYSVNSINRCTEVQYISGSPLPNSIPILFERPNPDYSYQGTVTTDYKNFATDRLVYTNVLDRSDELSMQDVLSGNFDLCGYVQSSSYGDFSESGSLGSAARIMGEYDSPISGGYENTNTELTDLEKAIYTLAQQQGIGYEQMLEQSKIIMDNGQLYIEGIDGIAYSISSLTAQFDKLVEQGQFVADNAAATTEQLKAVLEYLKTLNIEGIEAYIQKIEGILNDLQQGDINREELLGDIFGSLSDINQYLESLGLDSVSANIKAISEAIAEAQAKEAALEELQKQYTDEISAAIPFNNNFKLYNQCKYFIETVFNYDDVLQPPNFSFYWDSDGDGVKEIYNPIDLSFLETYLTNENMVDKSLFSFEIKIIDIIRYVIAIVTYGLFVMRLLKRLPTFYGSGPWAQL